MRRIGDHEEVSPGQYWMDVCALGWVITVGCVIWGLVLVYPAVVINWVQYLGPPGPSSSSSRFSEDFLGREREWGGSLGDPPGA